jgi:hypothetical protein
MSGFFALTAKGWLRICIARRLYVLCFERCCGSFFTAYRDGLPLRISSALAVVP